MKRYFLFLTGMMLILSACEQQTLQDTITINEQQELTGTHLHDGTCSYECYVEPDYTKEVNIKLPFTNKAISVTVDVADGLVFYQGDIILGTEDDIINRGVGKDSDRWPNSTIPYVIATGFSANQLNRILNAIDHVNENSPLCVVPRTNEVGYVEFKPSDRCASYIGMRGNKQSILLSSGCSFGTTVHEILHASGIYHEQAREDRDNYVNIHYPNIRPGYEHNFNIAPTATASDYGAYDYGSIMHYGTNYFSSNGQATITTIPLGIPIGQRDGLSDGDIATLEAMYNGCNGCGGGGGTTASGCDISISISGLNITLTSQNFDDNGIVKIRTSNWTFSEILCNDWTGDYCTSGKSVTVPAPGTYVVDVQDGGGCIFTINVTGTGGGGANDNDSDGVCSDVDCDDNDPNVGAQQTPGTACDDGLASTTNDVIQADGCTCQGQSVTCNNFVPVNENCSGVGVEICGDKIRVNVSGNNLSHITINDVDAGWAVVNLVCANWSNNCDPGFYTYTVPQSGNYSVQFHYSNLPTCGTPPFYVDDNTM